MKVLLVLFFSILFFLSGCGNPNRETAIDTLSNIDGKKITVTVKRVKDFTHKQKIGILSLTIPPQIAIWLEDKQGNYIDTLFVTKSFGKQKWHFVKYDPDKPLRTSCLPYWMNKRLKAGLAIPTKNNPLTDAITSATPMGSFVLNSRIKKDLTDAVILAEFNKSFDPNEAFHISDTNMTLGKVNGQPSLVYSAQINLTDSGKPVQLTLIGHGGETGDDGTLYTNLAGLTTVLDIVDSITVQF